MANRKRNIQMKFYVTEDEKRLIDEKMSQLPTRRYGAYLRKMAIDGYIIYTDTADIKAFTKELSAIGRNVNQIAKRINAGGPASQANMEEIRERLDEIWQLQSRSAELALVMKHAGTYRQLKPLYERYRKSNDKEKFLRGHESEIILFEAAARELKRLGAVPLPTTESMKTELANLSAEKERLLAEYKTARTEAQKYETVKQNVDALLAVPMEQEQQRRHELE